MTTSDPVEHNVTRALLAPLVEQPEPSVDGDWYVLAIRDLTALGYTHIQVHFDHDANEPNAAGLIKDAGVFPDDPEDCDHGRWNPDNGQCLDCGHIDPKTVDRG